MAESAKTKLLKRIQDGYKPLAKTLQKYDISGVESKEAPPKRVRDPKKMKEYTKTCYERHRFEYSQRNALYKIANGYRLKPETLRKYELPEDIHALHPLVLNRKTFNA